MAILMPARTGIELYEEALADAGIPYRHEGSRDFYSLGLFVLRRAP